MNVRAGDLLRRILRGFLAWVALRVDTRLERDPDLQDVRWDLFWEGILSDPNRCPEYHQQRCGGPRLRSNCCPWPQPGQPLWG